MSKLKVFEVKVYKKDGAFNIVGTHLIAANKRKQAIKYATSTVLLDGDATAKEIKGLTHKISTKDKATYLREIID